MKLQRIIIDFQLAGRGLRYIFVTVNAIPHYDLFSFLTLIGKGGNSHFFNYRLHVENFVKLSLLMGEKSLYKLRYVTDTRV